MKKILVTILLLAIFLSLTSCNEDNKGNQDEEGSGYFLVQYDYGNITKDEVPSFAIIVTAAPSTPVLSTISFV